MKDNKTDAIGSLLSRKADLYTLVERPKYDFRGWADEGCENPTENGLYLCLVKRYNYKGYEYEILEYHTDLGWKVTNIYKHILWTNLQPSPFDK